MLEGHGLSQTELAGIRVISTDGYSMEIPSEILKNRDIILACEMDGRPLFDNKHIKVVVPGERAMYWVSDVSVIEIAKRGIAVSKQVEKILIFEAVISDLNKYEYEYHKSSDKAIKTNDLLSRFVREGKEQVFIKAADGLQRNETREIFKNAFIKITGENNPMFLSPDLPEGMHVKGVLWFSSEKTAFLAMDKALEAYSRLSSEGIEGILLKDVLEDIDLKHGNAYIFKANDGYSVEISKGDIYKGILYKVDDGSIRVGFEGLAKNTTVRGLISIEAE